MACRLGRFSKKPAQQYRWRLWGGKARDFIRLCRIGRTIRVEVGGRPDRLWWCGVGRHWCDGWCLAVQTQVHFFLKQNKKIKK